MSILGALGVESLGGLGWGRKHGPGVILLMTVRSIMRRQSPTFNANRGLRKALLEADGVVGDCSPLGIVVFMCFG